MASCQETEKPNQLMADTLEAMLVEDPTTIASKGDFDTEQFIATPVNYEFPRKALIRFLDAREKNSDGILKPSTEFLLSEVGEDKVQIYVKLRLLSQIPLFLPQVMVRELRDTDPKAAESLNNKNSVNFPAQRVARQCYVLIEDDGTFYNFDDSVSRFNNKLLSKCREDIQKIVETFNKEHPILELLNQ
ncbi:MAG: hypothetical protein ABJP82_03845 [Hyphomicrobiales bacterium]